MLRIIANRMLVAIPTLILVSMMIFGLQKLLPGDPVAPLHLAHCDAMARGEMSPGQEIALLHK